MNFGDNLIINVSCVSDIGMSYPMQLFADEPSYRNVDTSSNSWSIDEPLVEKKMDKRRVCRKYFVYNPVRGKCQPTLLVSLSTFVT